MWVSAEHSSQCECLLNIPANVSVCWTFQPMWVSAEHSSQCECLLNIPANVSVCRTFSIVLVLIMWSKISYVHGWLGTACNNSFIQMCSSMDNTVDNCIFWPLWVWGPFDWTIIQHWQQQKTCPWDICISHIRSCLSIFAERGYVYRINTYN